MSTTTSTIPHPPIVSQDQWVAERKKLLAQEKELTKHYDRVNAERRRAWFSSFGSDFNYDYHVTLDPKVAPTEYNYRSKAEMAAAVGHPVKMEGEAHGLSVFFQLDDDVFHTYSTYARGAESLSDSYRLLDMTPYGRQQDFEDSPPGWPQKPTYG
jgi:predicted dithiol-disulfide oxidoreductase (DUF899 family)